MAESSDDDTNSTDSEMDIFECSEPGCVKISQNFSELESHLDIEDDCVKEKRQMETLYDKLHRDWVDRFTTSVNITEDAPCAPSIQQSVSDQIKLSVWAGPYPSHGQDPLSSSTKFIARNFEPN